MSGVSAGCPATETNLSASTQENQNNVSVLQERGVVHQKWAYKYPDAISERKKRIRNTHRKIRCYPSTPKNYSLAFILAIFFLFQSENIITLLLVQANT